MGIKSTVRRTIIRTLQLLGYDFDKISLEGVLERFVHRGTRINTVIDIGASNGMWTKRCVKYLPDAHYFLVEAQPPHEPALRKLREKMPNMSYIMAAAGDREGVINFDASELFGGLAGHEPFSENNIVVPVTTIDAQVKQRKLQPPFLLKLDTHGFELAIFEGAQETLRQTALLVVEVYNFRLTQDSLRFHEMCSVLEEKGFRTVDICEPLHRPDDRALWQFDLFFEPVGSSVFDSDSYK